MLKIFFENYMFSSGGHFVWQRETVCTILVEGIIRNIHMKLFFFRDVILKTIFSSGGHFVCLI